MPAMSYQDALAFTDATIENQYCLENREACYEAISALENVSRYDLSLPILEKCTEGQPYTAEMYGQKVTHLLALGRKDAARVLLEKWTEQYPGAIGAYYFLGETCLETNRPEQAEQCFRHLIGCGERQSDLYRLMGLAMYSSNPVLHLTGRSDWRDAVEQLHKAASFPIDGLKDGATIVHYHVPFTGGATLTKMFENVYYPWQFLASDFGLGRDQYDAIKMMNDERKSTIRHIRLHNAVSIHGSFKQPCKYFTLFRDPHKMFLSSYYWPLAHKDYECHQHWVPEHIKKEQPLSVHLDWLTSASQDNLQSRFLAVINAQTDPPPYVADKNKLWEEAQKVLSDHFVFCGICDDFCESAFIIFVLLGFDRIPLWQTVAPSGGNKPKELEPGLKKAVEELLWVDFKCYTKQKELFQTRFADFINFFRREIKSLKINR
jgi:tetratricopeptide (TPR) repeat protein